MSVNYKQLYVKKQSAENRIKSICPNIPNTSGIYVFARMENGIKYCYIGQALHIKQRCAEHLIGYQHIDNSIKKHGFYDEIKNPTGYKLLFYEYPEHKLNEMERHYIQVYAENGYQLRNKTIGGQDCGKFGTDDNRPSKGYYDGLKQGYENCRKEVIVMFEKYLNYSAKGKGKIAERKLKEFEQFLTPIAMDRLERIENLKDSEDN